MSSGYSQKPLSQKLGLKSGQQIFLFNAPQKYQKEVGIESTANTPADKMRGEFDFIHFFTQQRAELENAFFDLKAHLKINGMLWISWPKKSAKIPTDLDENIIREIGLRQGLVDVKVCAIDEIWAGLKFVRRLKDRV